MKSESELVRELSNERYRNLKIWNDAIQFAGAIYDFTSKFPADERFGLTSQLRRAAVSVASNIAEGSKRLPAENKNFLRYALGSLAECDTQLCIAENLGYGVYSDKVKAEIMALMMGVRAYAKTI